MTSRTRTTPAMVQRAYELAAQRWQHTEIARELGNSASCVSRILSGHALPKACVILTTGQLAELPEKYRRTPRQITASPTFRACFICHRTHRSVEKVRECFARHDAPAGESKRRTPKPDPAQEAEKATAPLDLPLPPGRDELAELQEEIYRLAAMRRDLVSRCKSWGLDERDVDDLGRIFLKLEVLDESQLRLRLVGGES